MAQRAERTGAVAHQLRLEEAELEEKPDEEERELRAIYEAKGIPPNEALALAHRIVRGDRRTALETMAREELGIDPHELGGSAWVASMTSFMLFALGAAVPLLPFVVAEGPGAVIAASVLAGATLAGIGAFITRLTAQPPLRAALRQLAFGAVAAAITFGIGRLVGTAIG